MDRLRLYVDYANSPLSCQAIEEKDRNPWCPGQCSLVLRDWLSFRPVSICLSSVYLHINCLLWGWDRREDILQTAPPIIS